MCSCCRGSTAIRGWPGAVELLLDQGPGTVALLLDGGSEAVALLPENSS